MNPSSGHLHKFLFGLRRILKAWEEKTDETADMVTKVEKLFEQAPVRVVFVLVTNVSDHCLKF